MVKMLKASLQEKLKNELTERIKGLTDVSTEFSLYRFSVHALYNMSSFMIFGPFTGLIAWLLSGRKLATNAMHLPTFDSRIMLYMMPNMMYANAVVAGYTLMVNRRTETEPHMMLDSFPFMLYFVCVFIRIMIIGIRYGTITNKEYNTIY